jgi:DNA-binding MarR family transcriptional regulator
VWGGMEQTMESSETYQAWILIDQTARVLKRAVDARLQPWNLNHGQATTLCVLAEHGPQPMSHLSRLLLQQTQTTTDLVDRLERRGLAQRVRHATDRRVVLVAITDEGRAFVEASSAAVRAVGAEVFGGFAGDELARITEAVRRVRDAAAAIGGIPAEHMRYAEDYLGPAPACQGVEI